MLLGRLPSIILLIDGAALLGVGIHESLTGSWLGGLVAGSLGLVFLVSAAHEQGRRAGPSPLR